MLRVLLLAALFCLFPQRAAAEPMKILFIGNSFTFGSLSPVHRYLDKTVTDLNGDGVGGVPALVKQFADQSGVPLQVSLETSPGKTLAWHLATKRGVIDRRWDAVVMQEYSTLNPSRPGDPAATTAALRGLVPLFLAKNPKVRLLLTSTWTRPDLTFIPGKHWSGQPIGRMATDLRKALEMAVNAAPGIERINPVGEAFTCAINQGLADANPYDGIDAGKLNLWAYDHYHASAAGYYLEALTVFAGLTGKDPRTLGRGEAAARDLGIDPAKAAGLQDIAFHLVRHGRCPAR